ncbi:MAG: hypothetical protein B6D63_00100 [Candidatus Latescibacteria bacterium 4484_7]|nr:MAG: hypothetical protein B6D63_00100 [Candidatus Latescibacteria bacterium 4484_7]RKZ05457.1 MAG: DUF502 domain-containing protein [bacterium]
MNWLRKTFLTGLVILLPTVLTLYILYKFFVYIDNIMKPLVVRYPIIDFPGLGFVGVILIIFLVGIFAGNLIGKRIIGWLENLIARIPMISRMYTAIKQISEVFLGQERTVFKEAVLIEYPRHGVYAIGFVTSYWDFKDARDRKRRFVNIFLPTTPNPTSGFFLMVPEDEVTPMHCSMEDALKMVISGGAVLPLLRQMTDAVRFKEGERGGITDERRQ